MSKRKAKRKPPRVVLADLRSIHDLEELSTRLRDYVERLDGLTSIMQTLAEHTNQLVPIIGELHRAQEKRSAAARKANATRSTRQGSASESAEPVPSTEENHVN